MAETKLIRRSAFVAAACLLAVAVTYAYPRAFAFFSGNDDEGYILQSIRSYLEGHRLFEEIFTQYGPAFYVLESLIHQTFRAPLTHDFERWWTVGLWVAASAASAATVLRLTRSRIAAGLTFVGVFVHLTPLIGEPGHPQGPLVLVIALVTLLATWDLRDARSRRYVTAAGVLTAFALLVKVNVGTYLALGFAIPVFLWSRMPRSRINAVLLAAVATGACVLPLVVTRNHVQGWAFNYALITSLSLASTIVAIAWPRRTSLPWGVVFCYAAATGIAFTLLLLPSLVRGTSLAALLTGIIIRPSQFDRIFFLPLVLPATGLFAAGAGLALSVGWVLAQRGRAPSPALVAGAKILVAAAGLYLARLGLGYQLAWFTPFLWVVAVPPDDSENTGVTIGRGILALVAVFQSLQAYPVAGSQLAFATFLMIPIAFVCAHDAFAILERRLPERRVLSWAFQLSFVVAGALFYRPFLGPFPWRAAYDAGYELRLAGAERLRLPAADVARYHWLSATVAANCGALLTLPGLYSLNAWSGVAPANGLNATAWVTLLSATEQESIWRAVDDAKHACVVYNPGLAVNWLLGRPLETLPAYREMSARFRQIAESDGYRLLMRDADVQPSGVEMRLVSGRQVFERRRSPLPILANFAVAPATSTVRLWVKSRRTGVIVGCQSQERVEVASRRWLPMFYIGGSGKLYGQHWTADSQVHSSARAVNDGSWHHVALVKEANKDQHDQRLYVDGDLVGSSRSTIETAGLSSCQAGTGATSLWPDGGPRGWMPFNGEIDGLGVSLRAWSAREVADDWRQTKPN